MGGLIEQLLADEACHIETQPFDCQASKARLRGWPRTTAFGSVVILAAGGYW